MLFGLFGTIYWLFYITITTLFKSCRKDDGRELSTFCTGSALSSSNTSSSSSHNDINFNKLWINDLSELTNNYIINTDSPIGYGSYSVVYECKHKYNKFGFDKKLAIKKSIYHNKKQEKRYIDENKLQYKYSNKLNCYLLYNDTCNNQIISIWDYHQYTLYNVINKTKLITNINKKEKIISNIIHKILIKLQYLHSNNIIHHDLTLSNILISSSDIQDIDDLDVYIIDYGFSKYLHANKYAYSSNHKMIPQYTLYYCAWELLNCVDKINVAYNHKIDVYALGVICFKLLVNNRDYIFRGNLNRNIYISKMISAEIKHRGITNNDCIHNKHKWKYLLNCLNVRYHHEFYKNESKLNIVSIIIQKLNEMNCSIECLHFISKLLENNPNKRFTAKEALNHPFIQNNL